MAIADQTQDQEKAEQAGAATHAHPAPHAKTTGPGLARIEAIKGKGWDAVEEVAEIIEANPAERHDVMTWLQQHRGNDFVQHVVGELSGAPPKAAKFPIVLLHGLGASPASFDSAIPAAMRADGDAVFEVTAPPFESPEARAQALAPQLEAILQKTGATKLNLIGWSEGGLDARYLISSMGWADRVASLSMLGTPNRGTPVADKIVEATELADGVLGTIHQALGKLASPPVDSKGKTQLSPELKPILLKLDQELGTVIGTKNSVSLKALAGEIQVHESKLTGELAARARELAHKLQAAIPASVEPTLNGIAHTLGTQAGNSDAGDTNVHATLESLSEADAAAFNKANPNAPGVYYQSWAGVGTSSGKLNDGQLRELEALGPMHNTPGVDPHIAAKLPPKLIATSLAEHSKANGDLGDGAVPVKSAEWGDFRGEIPADHLDLVDSRGDDQSRTGFNAVEFYRKIAQGLAKRGY